MARARAGSTLSYETIDVFTNTACGGNPLGVCFVPESVELVNYMGVVNMCDSRSQLRSRLKSVGR